MVAREKSRRGLRPAGFAVNPVLWDATRRAGKLPWPRRGVGERRHGAVVLEVTSRGSNGSGVTAHRRPGQRRVLSTWRVGVEEEDWRGRGQSQARDARGQARSG
jgi:hypothetical protein